MWLLSSTTSGAVEILAINENTLEALESTREPDSSLPRARFHLDRAGNLIVTIR
jgi:hypothetical protein